MAIYFAPYRGEVSPITKHAADTNRRRFIKRTVTGLAAVPFANALFNGNAEAVDVVGEPIRRRCR